MSKIGIDKIRIGGSKVRTGCITCKSRHVKCDETKPFCNRCVKAGRSCEGYSPAPTPTPLPIGYKFVHYVETSGMSRISRSPSPFVEFDDSSLRAWNFFINSTAVQLQRPFPAKIWSEYLTRLAHSNGAIKHGIVALASLHENFMSLSDPDTGSSRHVLALEHYGKSIRDVVHANQQSQESAVLTTLVSSLLFCAIESVQGHMLSALKHISAGLSLLAEHRDTMLTGDSEEDREFPGFTLALQQIFFNLAGQSLSYEDRSIMNNAKLIEYLQRPSVEAGSHFVSLEKAGYDLTKLFNDIILFTTFSESRQIEVDYPGSDLIDVLSELQSRYDAWIQVYHQLLVGSSGNLQKDTSECQALLELRVNQLLCRICLKISFDSTQAAFDVCRSEFEDVVQSCEDLMMLETRGNTVTNLRNRSQGPAQSLRISFRMSLGVIPGLLFTCTKCRDQPVRYRALQILKTIKRRECIWDSDMVSTVGERFVQIEERNALEYWERQGYPPNLDATIDFRKQTSDSALTQLSIPESARIQSMIVDLPEDDGGGGRAGVAFLMTGDPNRCHTEYMSWENLN